VSWLVKVAHPQADPKNAVHCYVSPSDQIARARVTNPTYSTDNQIQPAFLRLPVALRVLIYDIISSVHDVYKLSFRLDGNSSSHVKVMPTCNHNRALARTCKKLHSEYQSVPYTIINPEQFNFTPNMLTSSPGGYTGSPIVKLQLVLVEPRAWRALYSSNLDTLRALAKLDRLIVQISIVQAGATVGAKGEIVH
jgi:hypothetical protein